MKNNSALFTQETEHSQKDCTTVCGN